MDIKRKEELTGWSHLYSSTRDELHIVNVRNYRIMFTIFESETELDFSTMSDEDFRKMLEEEYRDEIAELMEEEARTNNFYYQQPESELEGELT